MSVRSAKSTKSGPVVATCGHALQRQSAVHGTAIPSWLRPLSNAAFTERPPATTEALQRAASEPAHSVSDPLRNSLEQHLGNDFSEVKVHDGPASAKAAERLGARAYTLGNDIHLGAEARGLPRQQFDRLLTHEAVHTVQQGGRTAAPHAGLAVSSPTDAGEQEAERIANSASAQDWSRQSSRSLALRDQMRASVPGQHIARSVSPQIQRDLTGKYPTTGGDFNLNLKTESHPGGTSGMKGTISFKAGDAAPDSTSIRLLQVAKVEDLTAGKDWVWTGDEANRNKTMTKEDKATGVEGGWFVDHSAAIAKQRTKKKDPAVSPYYRDYWPNKATSHDGSKKGKAVVEASLWDFPNWNSNARYSFETAAKASDTGHVYGTVMWGFTISDASKGKIEHERAVGRNVTLLSSDKALEKFNQFYRNEGASTAPKK